MESDEEVDLSSNQRLRRGSGMKDSPQYEARGKTKLESVPLYYVSDSSEQSPAQNQEEYTNMSESESHSSPDVPIQKAKKKLIYPNTVKNGVRVEGGNASKCIRKRQQNPSNDVNISHDSVCESSPGLVKKHHPTNVNKKVKAQSPLSDRVRRGQENGLATVQDHHSQIQRVRRGQDQLIILDEDSGHPYLRCNIHTAIKDIKGVGFQTHHLKSLMRTPFWYFIDASLTMDATEFEQYKKCDGEIAKLLKRFKCDPHTGERGFKLGRETYCPTRYDVELLLGVRDGARPIRVGKGVVRGNQFLARCFPGPRASPLINKKLILDTIAAKVLVDPSVPHVVDDIARLTHMYLLTILFMANQNNNIGLNVVKYIENLDNICMYDWCTYMLDSMIESIEKTKSLNVVGCSVMLMFWLCEICPLIEPREYGKQFPRFRKWSLEGLKNVMASTDLSRLDFTQGVMVERLNCKKRELKYLDSDVPMEIPFHTPCPAHVLVDTPLPTKEVSHTSGTELDDVGDIVNQFNNLINEPYSSHGNSDFQAGPSGCVDFNNIQNNMSATNGLVDGFFPTLDPSGSDILVGSCVCDGGDDANQKALWSTIWESILEEKDKALQCAAQKRDELQSCLLKAESDMITVKMENDRRIKELEVQLDNAHAFVATLTVERDNAVKFSVPRYEAEVSRIKYESQIQFTALEDQFKATSEALLSAVSSKKSIADQLEEALVARKQSEIKISEIEGKLAREKTSKESLIKQLEAMSIRESQLKEHVNDLTLRLHMQSVETEKKQTLIDKLDLQYAQTEDFGPCNSTTMSMGLVCYSATPTPDKTGNNNTLVNYSCSEGTITPITRPMLSQLGTHNHTPVKPSNLFPGSDGKDCSARGLNSTKRVTFDDSAKKPKSILKVVTPKAISFHSGNTSFHTPEQSNRVRRCIDSSFSEVVLISCSPVSEYMMKEKRQDTIAGKEVIQVVEVVNPESCATPLNKMRKFVIRPELESMSNTGQYILDWLEKKFDQHLPGYIVLKIETSTLEAEISLNDFELIVNNGCFTDSIIDVWALFHMTKMWGNRIAKDTRVSSALKPFYFKSACWLYVTRFYEELKYRNAAIRFIDNKIPDALKHENWILPINTSGSLCPLKYLGNHWTLLHYNVPSNQWTFYNSISVLPQKDSHFKAAIILKDYIEVAVKEYCGKTGVRIPLLSNESKWTKSPTMPVQAAGTVDCGPAVCYAVEMMIWDKPVNKDPWTVNIGGQFRAHMAKLLYDSIVKNGNTPINK